MDLSKQNFLFLVRQYCRGTLCILAFLDIVVVTGTNKDLLNYLGNLLKVH